MLDSRWITQFETTPYGFKYIWAKESPVTVISTDQGFLEKQKLMWI